MEQLLEFYGVSLDQKVRMAALYLEKKPLQWYRWSVSEKGGPLDWHEFERGLISLYDSTKTLEYAGKLSKLKQEGNNYDDYQPEFIRLSHHVHGLAQDYLISCFISGPRDQMKHEIEAKGPQTVNAAMWLAKLEEDKNSAIRRTARVKLVKVILLRQPSPASPSPGRVEGRYFLLQGPILIL